MHANAIEHDHTLRVGPGSDVDIPPHGVGGQGSGCPSNPFANRSQRFGRRAGTLVVTVYRYIIAGQHITIGTVAVLVELTPRTRTHTVLGCHHETFAPRVDAAVRIEPIPQLNAIAAIWTAHHAGGRERIATTLKLGPCPGIQRAIDTARPAVQVIAVTAELTDEGFVGQTITVIVETVANLLRRHTGAQPAALTSLAAWAIGRILQRASPLEAIVLAAHAAAAIR